MDPQSVFQQQVCSLISILGPRLTKGMLGASGEMQLVTWLSQEPESATLKERAGIACEALSRLTLQHSNKNAASFFTTRSDVLGTSPLVYILTMPADGVEDTRDHILSAVDDYSSVSHQSVQIDISEIRMNELKAA